MSTPQESNGSLPIQDELTTKSAPPPPSQVSIKELITTLAADPADMSLEETSNMLTQKAFFLLGLAEQLENDASLDDGKQKPRDLISLLQQDAKECMSFALSVKDIAQERAKDSFDSSANPETVEKLEKLKATLSKYDDSVLLRTKNIVQDSISSNECKNLLDAGKGVLNRWLAKRDMVVGKLLDHQDENLSSLDTHFSSLLDQKGNLAEFIADIRVDVVTFLNALNHHKETIMNAVNEIEDVLDEKDDTTGQSLKDDEDLKFLLSRVKARVGDVTNAVTDDENQGDLESAAGNILDSVESQDLVKKGLQHATDFLQKNEEFLDPENLLSLADDDGTNQEVNKKKIQKFISVIKDELLSFLLGYLPTVKIKPLEHDDENCTYKLDNIDLSKFTVKSEDVDVLLIDNGVFVCASNISCEMDNLVFSYSSKSFPYPRCNGKLHGHATNISIALELKLEVTAFTETPSATISLDENVFPLGMPDEQDDQIRQIEYKSEKDSHHLLHPQQSQNISPSTSNTSNISISPTSQDNLGVPVDGHTVTKRLLHKLNSKLDNRYKLVLVHHPTHGLVKIGDLKLELKDFSFLKSLANYLLNLFKNPIRDYVQKTINNVILKESEQLLTKINDKVQKYLPVIAKLLVKIEHKAPQLEKIVVSTVNKIQKDVRNDRQQLEAKGLQGANDVELHLPNSDELLILSQDKTKSAPAGNNAQLHQSPDQPLSKDTQ